MAENAPAGWYPLPDGTQRYWDGHQWTEHIAPGANAAGSAVAAAEPVAEVVTAPMPAVAVSVPAAVASAATVPGAVPIAPVDERPWWRKKRFIIPGAAVIAFFGIGILGASGNDDNRADAPSPTPSVNAPSSSPTPTASGPTTFTMPNLVGMDLQDAQNALQALGSSSLTQVDASGQDRAQLVDHNWTVCDQKPEVSSTVELTFTVELSSVKDGETCPGDEPAVTEAPSPSPDPQVTEPAAKPEETKEPEEKALTATQEQAVAMADEYIAYTAFSRSGLIDQLKYEGFTAKQATFAVDYIDVNWNAQAKLKAQDYLDYQAFSRSGLIDQLKYEGFSSKQATKAVDSLDVSWNRQATLKAQEYLDYQAFSRSGLIDQLEYEGFTYKQAVHGVNAVGL